MVRIITTNCVTGRGSRRVLLEGVQEGCYYRGSRRVLTVTSLTSKEWHLLTIFIL